MSQKLTLALLQGKEYRETVDLELDGQTFQVEIRPLTHIEKSEIQAIESRSIKMQTKKIGKAAIDSQEMEMNTGDVIRDSAQAEIKLIALGTVDPEWNEQTIDQHWRAEWIEQVSEKIREISGIESKRQRIEKVTGESVESFREK
jgi:hypothetical protein